MAEAVCPVRKRRPANGTGQTAPGKCQVAQEPSHSS